MDSRRRPDPGRAGLRRRVRLFAITAWSGFLGATAAQLANLALHEAAPFGWGDFSLVFLSDWAIAMGAIAFALVLALPPPAGASDGR